MTLVAALLVACAVALLLPARPTPDSPAPHHGAHPSLGHRQAARGPVAVVCVVAGALVATVDGRRLALGLIVVAAAVATGLLMRQTRRAKAAERRQERVVEVCEALVGELRAGQPLVTALEHCAQVWPEFEPVVAAGRLGADVPAALRRLGALPGAEGLREVAAAWQVSQRSGAGLATALAQVAGTARQQQSTRHLVQGELASAQATARLVAVLPVASMAMSAGIGGEPWGFLLDTPAGLACLGLGVLLAFAGLLWIDRIASAVLRGS